MPRVAVNAAADRPLATLPDEVLFEGVCQGSERHFNVLYERYFDRVYGFIYNRVRNHADAEELSQESFTAVFRSASGYSGRSTPLAWIYGIAKNTVYNHLRRARSQTERLDRAGPEALHPATNEWGSSPEDDLVMHRYVEAISASLDSVTPWQVEVFVMRHLENLTIGEIARRTERSNDAVRSSLYRIKRLMVEAGGFEGAGALS